MNTKSKPRFAPSSHLDDVAFSVCLSSLALTQLALLVV